MMRQVDVQQKRKEIRFIIRNSPLHQFPRCFVQRKKEKEDCPEIQAIQHRNIVQNGYSLFQRCVFKSHFPCPKYSAPRYDWSAYSSDRSTCDRRLSLSCHLFSFGCAGHHRNQHLGRTDHNLLFALSIIISPLQHKREQDHSNHGSLSLKL